MKSLFSTLVLIIGAVISVSAQSEGDLKQYFEGRNVTLKLDMPATKDGVNVYPEREQPLNYGEYANRLKRHGISVRRGDMIMITKVKVKDKHIELQLGGGGYGTVGDETDSSANASSVSKSRREKNLEDALKDENDPTRRKRIKRELDELRREREREDERNKVLAAEAQEARRARIEQKALQAGSRFNVHFTRMDSLVMTPSALIDALRRYLEFEESAELVSPLQQTGGFVRHGVVHVGPRTTYLKAGLKTEEVLRLLGEPSVVSARTSKGTVMVTYEFARGEGRVVVAEFVGDQLVRSRTETRIASVTLTNVPAF